MYDSEYQRDYYQKHKKYYENWRKKNKSRQRQYRCSLKGKISTWISCATRRGLKWSLTETDLSKLPLICAYSGTPLTMETGKDNSVSIDRIDSKRGYIVGNVVFCTSWVNRMKQEKPTNEFVQMCRKIVEHNERHG